MSYTKREFIQDAYAELGRASYVFDLQPEDLQLALRRLDTMMAEWNAKGIRLGYPLPSSPADSSLDQETNVPDRANNAIVLNLSLLLAPGMGKTPSQDTRNAAKAALNALLARAAMPDEMQLGGAIPMGAGHKAVGDDQVFFPTPTDQIIVGPDAYLSLE